MRIAIARSAGFCMGVRRAVDMVLDASNRTDGPIYTYGPLIHNPQVLSLLTAKNISRIDTIHETGEGIVLIRAHGVPPEDEAALEKAGFTVVNATCPRVVRVQSIIRKYAKKNYAAIIVGDKNHPEVVGLLGYAGGNGYTVSSMEELSELPVFDHAVVVAQTTQNTSFFDAIRKNLAQKAPHYKIFNTICGSTEKRQEEVRRIAGEFDAVVVVGGKQSGNTRRLAQIAGETARKTYHIEDISELNLDELSGVKSVAITAGASTPNWIINKAYHQIEQQFQLKRPFVNTIYRIRDFLLLSNLLLAAGAGSLTFACMDLQGLYDKLSYGMVAMLYILSMQIINNLFAIKSDTYNRPERAAFYSQYKGWLSGLAVVSGASGLVLVYGLDVFSFLLLFVMSVLGLSYNLKVVPVVMEKRLTLKRMRDLPGSKTILIAVAWGMVTTLLPACCNDVPVVTMGVAFMFATSLVFCRTAFFDVLEIQGDRITGKETLPILLGEDKSYLLIKFVLIAIFFVLVTASLLDFVNKTGFLLALLPLFMFYLIRVYKKGAAIPGKHLEFLMELHFIVAGLVSIAG
jgi:4-hydroxy-3-methylbut-2-enyl diphosphate reductase